MGIEITGNHQTEHKRHKQYVDGRNKIKSKTRYYVIHRAGWQSRECFAASGLETYRNIRSNLACQSPCGVPDDDVDDVAQNHYTSDSRVQKRAANELDREHDVKPLPVFQPLLTRGQQATNSKQTTQKHGG